MANFNTGWYLMYTRPRHEKKVKELLEDLKMDCFLPVTKKVAVYRSSKKTVVVPLFPSYIFVYLRDLADYYNGMQVDSVLNYVKVGKAIARVDESIVENIKVVTEKALEVDVSGGYFYPGQQVVIHEGPLKGLSCEIVQLSEKKKILVRVHILQRNLLCNIPSESLLIAS